MSREYTAEEYKRRFGTMGCPRCGCKEIKEFKRTHSHTEYTVCVCTKCKIVVGRKIT